MRWSKEKALFTKLFPQIFVRIANVTTNVPSPETAHVVIDSAMAWSNICQFNNVPSAGGYSSPNAAQLVFAPLPAG